MAELSLKIPTSRKSVLALIVILMVVLATSLQAYFSFRTATDDSFDSLGRAAAAIDYELVTSFQGIDALLTEITDRISPERWPDPALLPWLSGRLGASPVIDTVLVIGLDGASLGPGITAQGTIPLPLDVREREYFQYSLAHPDDHGSHVGLPYVSRFDNRFVLPMSRGFFDRDGKPTGLVRITLGPKILLSDFIALIDGNTLSSTVFFYDGTPLTGGSPRDPHFADEIVHGTYLRSSPSDAAGGTSLIVGATDGKRRLIAYRSLPRYNLMVVTGMRWEEAYGVWRRELYRNGALALVLCSAVFTIAFAFDRRDRRQQLAQQKHEADLERQVAERTAELQRENEIRARTEQALRASRERLRGITDSLFHGILVFNRAGHIVFSNIAARRMLGVDDQELEGLPIDHLLQVVQDGEALPFERSPLRSATDARIDVHGTEAVIRIGNSAANLDISYVCTPLGEESKHQAVMSFRDITDIKKAQWELLQASRLASVGQLASGIAHEINTPIQYIGNNLSFVGESVGQLLALLKELGGTGGAFRDERTAFLAEELPIAIAESLEGVGHIGRIVLSMKEFSHPGGANKSLTDINRALETTLTVSTAVWKHVAEIERRFDPDLPPVPCHAGEMNQVFLNLVVNAVHAIEASGKPLPGRITLSTAVRNGRAEITIGDSGTGIPPAIREKIFDPFFTTKEVGKGTGQGLAICRDVVIAKHGGTIGIGGTEGEGAVFVIGLPLDEPKGMR